MGHEFLQQGIRKELCGLGPLNFRAPTALPAPTIYLNECKVLKTLHFSLSCGIIGTNGDSAPPPLCGSFWVEGWRERQTARARDRERQKGSCQLNYKLQQTTNIPASSGRVGMDKGNLPPTVLGIKVKFHFLLGQTQCCMPIILQLKK